MSKSNPTLRALTRTLERSRNLVYFIDDNDELSFVNSAVSEWLDVPVERLQGARLCYTTDSNDSQTDGLQGLCPPPENPDATTGHVSFWVFRGKTEHTSRCDYCPAVATPISNEHGVAGRLIVADPTLAQAAPPTEVNSERTPQALHAMLQHVQSELHWSGSVESLIGTSSFAQRLRRQVKLASQGRADVLIFGPVGCGKEHLARNIYFHVQELRNEYQALAPIHCPIADPELIQQRIADARQAAGGPRHELILLLLEVDQLSVDAQAELLGFLQLPNFRLQTLATASQPIAPLAAQGKFSQPLADRLSALTIEMLPLHQRTEDIPLLAQHFLEHSNLSRGQQLAAFSNAALEQLCEFNWPENINQLLATIEPAVRRATGSLVTENDLPEEFHQALTAMRIGKPENVAIDLDQYLQAIEKELIYRAITQAKGNKTQAARDLNISRPKLLRRLAQLGLDEFLQPQTDPDSTSDSDQLDSSAFEELIE